MCIIIDTNSFASVFDPNSSNHEEFKPVFEWILKGKGKMIYGGTKYNTELSKARKYLKIFSLFNSKAKKVIVINKETVDKEEQRISELIPDKDFDDPHLAAIVSVSRCQLICSNDTRSIKYVTNSSIYPNGVVVPKYYTGKRNVDLLSDLYIDERYKPLIKCNKEQRNSIEMALSKSNSDKI